MADSIIGWQYNGRVCVAEFFPPAAFEKYEQWRREHQSEFGPDDEWIVNLGRAAGGGDWASVWVPQQHLPPDFPVADKHLGR